MATFYRKYRPQTFGEVVGQEHVVQTLKKALELNRLAHAYLFSGARGVGKTTLARILAKAVNCLGKNNRPCGKCRNCLDIANGRFVDLIEIDAASNRGIDEMRSLRDKVQFAPSIGQKRVYIIDEVHMLTREAFNALLKTLEEPPTHTLFIFATTEVHKVPVTILSRCQRFDFHLGSDESIKKNIKDLAKKEKLKLSDEVADLITRSAAGSYRDAQSILDQLSSHLLKKKLKVKDALKLLNLTAVEQVNSLLKKLQGGDINEIFAYLQELQVKNVDFSNLIDSLIIELRSNLIQGLCDGRDVSWAKMALEELLRAKKLAERAPVASLALELAAIELVARMPNENFSENSKAINDASLPLRRVAEKNSAKEERTVKITDLPDDQRKAIQDLVREKNMALGALLALAEWRVEGGKLCFVVEYPIYKDKILSRSALDIIDSCVTAVLKKKILISCRVERPADVGEEIEAVFREGV